MTDIELKKEIIFKAIRDGGDWDEVYDILEKHFSDSKCISDGGTCGLGGYCAECPHVKAIDKLRGSDDG